MAALSSRGRTWGGTGIARAFSYGNTGAPGPEFQINQTTLQNQDQPAVSMDDAGRVVAVWRNLSVIPGPTIITDIFARIYDGTGTPQGLEFRVNSTTGDLDNYPSVSMDADGGFVVVWSRGGSGQSKGIFGRRYDGVGTAQGAEFLVNNFTASAFIQDASVSMDARRFDAAGAAQGGEFLVNNNFIFGEQLRPDVALDAGGNFVVAWASLCFSGPCQDGTPRAVLARRYSSNGTPVEAEFVVNTYTTATQDRPSVAITRSGEFVVAWDSAGQDGSGYGVFAQRHDDVIFQDGFES